MPDPQAASIPDFLYGTAWKEERTAALVELALRAGSGESIRQTSDGTISRRELGRGWLRLMTRE
ncbi:MAG: hypothetical protein WB660_24290 [Candidatus Sulfotelmatobacter sp.]